MGHIPGWAPGIFTIFPNGFNKWVLGANLFKKLCLPDALQIVKVGSGGQRATDVYWVGLPKLWVLFDLRGGVPIIRIIAYWGLYWGPLFRETT